MATQINIELNLNLCTTICPFISPVKDIPPTYKLTRYYGHTV